MSQGTGIVAQALPGERVKISTDVTTEPFWRAAQEKRLTAPKCGSCGTFRLPPTVFCPNCQSTDLEWPTLSDALAGKALLTSWAIASSCGGQCRRFSMAVPR